MTGKTGTTAWGLSNENIPRETELNHAGINLSCACVGQTGIQTFLVYSLCAVLMYGSLFTVERSLGKHCAVQIFHYGLFGIIYCVVNKKLVVLNSVINYF